MLRKITIYSLVSLFSLIIISCNNDYIPKPKGYFRIDFPEKEYKNFNKNESFYFEYPAYTKIKEINDNHENQYRFNIEYPNYKAAVHITYLPVKEDIKTYLEDARSLVYSHSIKAEAIGERVYNNPEKNVHGILYEIKGNAASSIQFFLTDSTKNFFRGALYIKSIPNKDSLAPVIDFIQKDVEHMIETFHWKDKQ